MQNKLLKRIRQTKGQFFGLYTKQGNVINAKFLRETPNYINVYDRNNACERKLAKTSLRGVRSGDIMVGTFG